MSNQEAPGGRLSGLHIVLGVTGGIAAYKAAHLVRLLKRADADVVVAMTESACRFITPLTMTTLSGKPVVTSLWDNVRDPDLPTDIEHVGLAGWAHFAILAPATMNTLGKIAGGIADDALTTFFGAFDPTRSLLAPAMNVDMWDNRATQVNIEQLGERGYNLIGPDSGELACGVNAAGRMAEPEAIFKALERMVLNPTGSLAGKRVLVTAGPTRERFDPVRFWSNGSTGTQGLALAAAAHLRGARVTLIAGPGVKPSLPGITRINIESAAEMTETVLARAADTDITFMAAAVADWRPRETTGEKVKKGADTLTVEFEPTTDILAELGQRALGGFRVGFALESSDLESRAAGKLQRKNAHLIIGNLEAEGSGFGADTNEVLVVGREGFRKSFPRMDKFELGGHLVDLTASVMAGAKGGDDG
ncbi:MAG: bifunctional phosphopantothenoylcysteine decarboxylase/phosphopantothenate--cysteine ligase CoaBC [bacterium]|nr:bifunctional phosphopantothenoylcysteine decarboxylase/phosphopantothenate--cysteine ligase CoaBC [bacterium]